MIYHGTPKRIEINMTSLECCVEIDVGSSMGVISCYMLLAKCYEPYSVKSEVLVYIEDSEPRTLKIGNQYEFRLSIIFGNKCRKVDRNVKESFIQTENKNSSYDFVASIKKKIDDETAICSVAELGDELLVEFDESVNYLVEEDKITFGGELKAELVSTGS